MILYLGTSSLVKLYFEEPYSDLVRQWVKEAEIVASCRVAYTETMSALDVRFKKHDISKNDFVKFIKEFEKDWPNFLTVDFDEIDAARLVKKYDLRRFDAIHLSAAKLLRNESKDISLCFSSFDKTLCKAALAEGIRILTADCWC